MIPASVIAMLVLFIGLLVLEKIIGTKRVSSVLIVVNIPCGFSLKWINVFFTPSFTLLPLASKVSVQEAFEIGAVFMIGYLVTMILVAYFVWGFQKFANTKRRMAYEANEGSNSSSSRSNLSMSSYSASSARRDSVVPDTPYSQDIEMPSPQPIASVNRPHNPGVNIPEGKNDSISSTEEQQFLLPDKSKVIANFIYMKVDWIIYSMLGIVGIPIYFTLDYTMPLHLSIVILTFLSASTIVPGKYRTYLHPILLCGGSSILFIYLFSLMKHNSSLTTNLQSFKTGRNYLNLFKSQYFDVLPGAGDVLSSLLDVSIVALAIPMYNYRTDLGRHFAVLMIPSIVTGLASFFVYPPVSYAVGISNSRALAFMARSVTLALALPIVDAVEGSTSLVSVLAILSGIMGVLLGGFLLGKKVLRIRDDDYLTRGITLGICSSAVASANLLNIDPRAAAMSSLSFFLYGIVLIILSAITPLVNIVRSWVDLSPIAS